MGYFEDTYVNVDHSSGYVVPRWYQPGMTLQDAHEAIQQIELHPEFGVVNPTKPAEQGRNHWQTRLGNSFIEIRLRELFEGYQIDHDEAYATGLLGEHAFARDFLLFHEAELREELIWPIFSVYGTQQVSFANLEKFSPSGDWSIVLNALLDEGMLDRDRLLDEMLSALNRGFPAYRVRWFTRHYADFNPTQAETAARAHHLMAAVSSEVPSTVTFAVQQLSKLPEIDAEAFVAVAAQALAGTKATALTTLKMLERISQRREDLRPEIAQATQAGLHHQHDDVVRRSAQMLLGLDRRDVIAANRDALNPVMAQELLGTVEVEESPAVEAVYVDAEPLVPWSDDDALFRTRELLAEPTATGTALLVAWLAATGPRALEILRPVVPKKNARTAGLVPWLLWHCVHQRDDENSGPYFTGLHYDEDLLAPVIAIVRDEAPTRMLLSTPTDSWGRVDNAEFHRRMASYPDPDTIWRTDLALAQLRLVEFDAQFSGQTPPIIQAVEYVSQLQEFRDPIVAQGHRWRRTAQGWEHDEGPLDPQLPTVHDRNFVANPELPARTAIMAPTCLDAFTFAWTGSLESGMTPWPEFRDTYVLDVLTWHPGAWTKQTAAFLGLAMAHEHTDVRVQAAELVATRLPEVGAQISAHAWAQLDEIKLGRWASSLADAATLNPGFVHQLLSHLLPQRERSARDIAKLLEVLRNVHLSTGATLAPELREWLGGFSGRSKAATAAAALVKEA